MWTDRNLDRFQLRGQVLPQKSKVADDALGDAGPGDQLRDGDDAGQRLQVSDPDVQQPQKGAAQAALSSRRRSARRHLLAGAWLTFLRQVDSLYLFFQQPYEEPTIAS